MPIDGIELVNEIDLVEYTVVISGDSVGLRSSYNGDGEVITDELVQSAGKAIVDTMFTRLAEFIGVVILIKLRSLDDDRLQLYSDVGIPVDMRDGEFDGVLLSKAIHSATRVLAAGIEEWDRNVGPVDRRYLN